MAIRKIDYRMRSRKTKDSTDDIVSLYGGDPEVLRSLMADMTGIAEGTYPGTSPEDAERIRSAVRSGEYVDTDGLSGLSLIKVLLHDIRLCDDEDRKKEIRKEICEVMVSMDMDALTSAMDTCQDGIRREDVCDAYAAAADRYISELLDDCRTLPEELMVLLDRDKSGEGETIPERIAAAAVIRLRRWMNRDIEKLADSIFDAEVTLDDEKRGRRIRDLMEICLKSFASASEFIKSGHMVSDTDSYQYYMIFNLKKLRDHLDIMPDAKEDSESVKNIVTDLSSRTKKRERHPLVRTSSLMRKLYDFAGEDADKAVREEYKKREEQDKEDIKSAPSAEEPAPAPEKKKDVGSSGFFETTRNRVIARFIPLIAALILALAVGLYIHDNKIPATGDHYASSLLGDKDSSLCIENDLDIPCIIRVSDHETEEQQVIVFVDSNDEYIEELPYGAYDITVFYGSSEWYENIEAEPQYELQYDTNVFEIDQRLLLEIVDPEEVR